MYTQKDFSHLLGMTGFSDTLLNNHFTLYGGYVNNVNTLLKKMNEIRMERLDGNDQRKEDTAELHRRFGWEYNGMKLHELYFENLENKTVIEKLELNKESKLAKEINQRYESFENFKINLTKNVGMFRGIGWVALVKNHDGNIEVIWINEHNVGLLADSKIILIMDVWEHAFITDYGIKRADYINAFWENINWKVCEERFEK